MNEDVFSPVMGESKKSGKEKQEMPPVYPPETAFLKDEETQGKVVVDFYQYGITDYCGHWPLCPGDCAKKDGTE